MKTTILLAISVLLNLTLGILLWSQIEAVEQASNAISQPAGYQEFEILSDLGSIIIIRSTDVRMDEVVFSKFENGGALRDRESLIDMKDIRRVVEAQYGAAFANLELIKENFSGDGFMVPIANSRSLLFDSTLTKVLVPMVRVPSGSQ